jgi:gliding motility-associated-like protein
MVRDAAACATTWGNNPVFINNTGGPAIADVIATDETCGNADGSITITATGTEPLEYSIDNGTTWSANNTFTGLAAGNYFIMVRDAAACATTWGNNPVVIINTGGPAITEVLSTNETCSTSNGSITIAASGTGLVEYSIDGGVTWLTANDFSGLSGGDYNIMVRDENCTVSWENNPVILTNTPGIDDLYAEVTDATNGLSNGSVHLVVVGGTAPFEYQVDGSAWQDNDTITGLTIGTHTAYVRDVNGCEFSVEFIVGNKVLNDIEFGVEDQMFCLNIPIEIPIEARNFIDVVSVRIELTFDNSILTFDQVISNTPGMLWSPQLNVAGNVLTLRGSISAGTITIPSGNTLFTLNFIGNAAGISSLIWNSVEYVIYSGEGYTIPALFVQGKNVEVLPAPLISLEGGGVFCEGDSTLINVISTDGQSIAIQWNGPDGFNTSIPAYAFDSLTLAQAGLYTVAATNPENCTDTRQLTVQVNPAPQVQITYDSEILCAGTQHMLDAGSGYESYLWQDGSPLQTFIAREAGDYSVRVFNAYGCPGEAKVTLIPCTLSLSIPNAFTPLGTPGLNDVFKPVLTGDVVPSIFFMQIYNKWGQKIYETNDYDAGWDGNVNGMPAPSEVYSYVISFAVPGYIEAEVDSPVSGSVTLLR